MSTNKLSFCLLFVFLSSFCFSQNNLNETKDKKLSKHSFSVGIGINYNYIYGEKYFPLDTSRKHPATEQPGGNVGYTKKCLLSLQGGVLYNHQITKSIYIETGLNYFFERDQIIKDNDNNLRNIVNNYNTIHSWRLDTLKEENYYSHNIEVPVCVGFSIKRFSGSIGAKVRLFSYNKAIYKFLSNYETVRNSTSYIWNKHFKIFYPSLKLKYLIYNKKIPVSLYIAVDKGEYHHLDFQGGLIIKFCALK